MSETFLGNCMLCHSSPIEIRHINLYTIGSEGTYVCHECEMKLVEFACSLSQENGRRKMQARLTKLAPDSLKAGVLRLPESVKVENADPAASG